MKNYQIHLQKEQTSIPCTDDQSILDCTLAAGINHIHACGGFGKCSTCRIAVNEGLQYCSDRNECEQEIADKLNFPAQVRLACQTKINGDVDIRRLISDQIDMEIVNQQFADDSTTSLGSEKNLSIVFTDIENYTPFVEKFPPYDVVHVLNRYLMIMNQAVKDHGGFISDVAGDGILAVFGNESEAENSVIEAVTAVDEMLKQLQEFNKYLQLNYQSSFKIRVGIHYGPVILGPVDTGSMKKLAVMGDSVNMASRIEAANKTFGTTTLLSEDAYHKVQDQYADLKCHKTKLKGKSGEFKLFEMTF